MTYQKIIYFFLLLVLSNMQNFLIQDGSPSDIRGNFYVYKLGQNLKKPSSLISVSIQFARIRVLGCNYAYALYDFDPKTFRLVVQEFKQPGFACVEHQDRSVMQQLQLSITARRQNNAIVFKNGQNKQILQLSPHQRSFDEDLVNNEEKGENV